MFSHPPRRVNDILRRLRYVAVLPVYSQKMVNKLCQRVTQTDKYEKKWRQFSGGGKLGFGRGRAVKIVLLVFLQLQSTNSQSQKQKRMPLVQFQARAATLIFPFGRCTILSILLHSKNESHVASGIFLRSSTLGNILRVFC